MTNENALAIAGEEEERAAAVLAAMEEVDLQVAGMENLEDGDTGMPPRLRISQRNRPIEVGDGEAPAGSIVNSLTEQVYDHVEVVPVVFLPRTRIMWPETFSADNDPMCLSDDGKTPSSPSDVRNVTDPQSGPCADCPWAKFNEGEPPRCKMQRNFLVWLVEQQEPAILSMQSTSLASARQLTTLARMQGLKSTVVFTTRTVKDDRGSWHVPAFTKGRKLKSSEILALVEVRDELKNIVITADVEDAAPEAAPVTTVIEHSDAIFDDADEIPF